MEKLLEIKNLTKSYRQGTTVSTVVNNVSIGVGKGEFVVIMGTSGSGKTSLLHLIAGIDQFDKGTIMYTLPGAVRLSNAPITGHPPGTNIQISVR